MLITIGELRRWFGEDAITLVTRFQKETGRYGSEEAEAWGIFVKLHQNTD